MLFIARNYVNQTQPPFKIIVRNCSQTYANVHSEWPLSADVASRDRNLCMTITSRVESGLESRGYGHVANIDGHV